MTRNNILAGIILGLLGFVGNLFKLELFFGVDLLYGSFFPMLAILRYGAVAGIISGAIAGFSTYILWNHPWAIIIFVCEALFVSLRDRRHRDSIITSDILYWLFCGFPLVWLFYYYLMGLQTQATILIILKQSMNGVFNALMATIAHLVLQSGLRERDRLPSFQKLIFVAMVSLTLIPAFAVFTLNLRTYMRTEQERLVRMTQHTAELTRLSINRWLDNRHDSGGIDQARINEIISSIGGEHNVQVTLLDGNSRIIASTRTDLKAKERFVVPPDGIIHPEGEEGVYHWIPAPFQGASRVQMWASSLLVREATLASGNGWTVRVETPLRHLLEELSAETINALLMMFLVVLATTGMSHLFSNKLVRAVNLLNFATREFPRRLLSETPLQELPESRIQEMDGLINNFRQMAQALHDNFADLKSLNETLVQQVEQEKRHLREKEMLVKDLHDGIGGIVTNIAMLGQYGLLQKEAGPCHDILTRIVGLASDGSTEIRSFMNSIESGDSAWSDLLAEIKEYGERMFEPHTINLQVSMNIADGIPPVGPFCYVNIVRICREIIANIIKHAGARNVRLAFFTTAEKFELAFEDDGRGYDPATVKRRGLANMFARTREIGAVLTVSSSTKGTTVNLIMPLKDQEPGELPCT